MTDILVCDKCGGSNLNFEITKQRCNHSICWSCLGEHVKENFASKIKCPIVNCNRLLTDSSIRKVLSDDDTERYEQLMMANLNQKIKCLLPGCNNIFVCSDTTLQFECTECSLFNCVQCQAPHRLLTCDQNRNIKEAAEICEAEKSNATKILKGKMREMYRQTLKEMDNTDLIIYDNLLECPNCCRSLGKGDGVVLRCSHVFCRYCLNDHIVNSSNIPIKCISGMCNQPLEEREIRTLLSAEQLAIYIDRCKSCIKGKLDFIFQCQTPDCVYFVTYSKKPKEVLCPLCKEVNCTQCIEIHTNETCEQFKERIKSTPRGKNLLAIEARILKKELMRCLKCHQILQKISGCSWIQCSNCQFEMCWARQMRRWGPRGRGDTSDGCKCLVNLKYCAPNCGTCIPHHSGSESYRYVRAPL